MASAVETWLDRRTFSEGRAAERVWMALKSGLSVPHRNSAAWWLAAFGMLAAGLLTTTFPAEAQDRRQAIESAVSHDQIQRDYPTAEQPRPSNNATRQQTPETQRNPSEPLPSTAGPAAPRSPMDLSWLPYAILGVIGIALVFVLLRFVGIRLPQRNSAARKAEPVAAARVAKESVPEPERDRTFDEVDALAESGAFTEAVHRLLLLVQDRLRGRIEHGLQASLTSREILRRAKLPQEAGTSFATLVAAVEVSLFGMRAANAQTYALCRENSRRVLQAASE